MKQMLIATLLPVTAFNASGQRADTVSISKQDLEIKNVRPGKSTYVVYFKKTPTSPAERITPVKIGVESTVVRGRKVFAITQHWDSGSPCLCANSVPLW